MEEPIISVVVPTRNRAGLVPGLIAALERQEDVGSFEVVVVDDASTDDTAAILDELRPQASIAVVALHLDRQHGPAAARNAGWRAARAPLVAFTDDDCRPDVAWLSHLANALNEADLVQGRTLPDPLHASRTGAFSRTVETVGEWGF